MARQFYLPENGVLNAPEDGREWYLPFGGAVNEAEGFSGIAPSTFSSGETIPSPSLGFIFPPTFVSGETFASLSVLVGIFPLTFSSGETFPAPVLNTFIIPGLFTSAESFSPTIGLTLDGNTIVPLTFSSGESFGLLSGSASAGPASVLGDASIDQFGNIRRLIRQDLPPLPLWGTPFDGFDYWRWFEKLAIRARMPGQIIFDQLDKPTIKLIEFSPENRGHSDLSNILGGLPGDEQHWSTREKRNNLLRHWMVID